MALDFDYTFILMYIYANKYYIYSPVPNCRGCNYRGVDILEKRLKRAKIGCFAYFAVKLAKIFALQVKIIKRGHNKREIGYF